MRAGRAALESGDALAARRHYQSILDAGQGDAETCIMLAIACQRLNDIPALHDAIDKALAYDPRNLYALVMKGDRLVAVGNARAAMQFYGAAITLSTLARDLPAHLVENLNRAAQMRERLQEHMEKFLGGELAGAGYDERTASPRFRQSIDMLTGRRQLYTQQPRDFFFPELPLVQFFERDALPWVAPLEAVAEEIRSEFEAIRGDDAAFVPVARSSADVPPGDQHRLLGNRSWRACFLRDGGQAVEGNSARCPRTLAALDRIPMPQLKGRDPTAAFVVLEPGMRVAAHHGALNCRLTCWLPLEAAAGARLRVGNERRTIHRGYALVFDDSIEHDVSNDGPEALVLLAFHAWRPELTEDERRLLPALLAAADEYGSGVRVEWTG